MEYSTYIQNPVCILKYNLEYCFIHFYFPIGILKQKSFLNLCHIFLLYQYCTTNLLLLLLSVAPRKAFEKLLRLALCWLGSLLLIFSVPFIFVLRYKLACSHDLLCSCKSFNAVPFHVSLRSTFQDYIWVLMQSVYCFLSFFLSLL